MTIAIVGIIVRDLDDAYFAHTMSNGKAGRFVYSLLSLTQDGRRSRRHPREMGADGETGDRNGEGEPALSRDVHLRWALTALAATVDNLRVRSGVARLACQPKPRA